ncbi:hypothetical protein D3C86_1801540 [compost metagenome]
MRRPFSAVGSKQPAVKRRIALWMAKSGVRISWLKAVMKSLFWRSRAFRSLMSRAIPITPTIAPVWSR